VKPKSDAKAVFAGFI